MVPMGLFRDKRALELDRLGNSMVGRSNEVERLKNILLGIKTGLLPKLIGEQRNSNEQGLNRRLFPSLILRACFWKRLVLQGRDLSR